MGKVVQAGPWRSLNPFEEDRKRGQTSRYTKKIIYARQSPRGEWKRYTLRISIMGPIGHDKKWLWRVSDSWLTNYAGDGWSSTANSAKSASMRFTKAYITRAKPKIRYV